MIIIFGIQLSYSIQKRITGDRLPSKQRNVKKSTEWKTCGLTWAKHSPPS